MTQKTKNAPLLKKCGILELFCGIMEKFHFFFFLKASLIVEKYLTLISL